MSYKKQGFRHTLNEFDQIIGEEVFVGPVKEKENIEKQIGTKCKLEVKYFLTSYYLKGPSP